MNRILDIVLMKSKRKRKEKFPEQNKKLNVKPIICIVSYDKKETTIIL